MTASSVTDAAKRRRRRMRRTVPLSAVTTQGRVTAARNPHAGVPFDEDRSTIAEALEDVCVPALLCSMVHMTGDPSWVRGRTLPQLSSSADYQCGLTAAEQEEIRGQALEVITAYCEGGFEPVPLSTDVHLEMMSFLARKPMEGRMASLFLEDMQFDG